MAIRHSGCSDSEKKVNAFESQLLSAQKSGEAGGPVEDSTGFNMFSFQKALEQCFSTLLILRPFDAVPLVVVTP